MSIIKNIGNGEYADLRLTPDEAKKAGASAYQPSEDEREARAMVIRHFQLGHMTMYKPRREFNDMSVIGRMQIDQMSFNTYQPNNGEAPDGDQINGWRSRAIRPVVRNKCISIAAHATARLIFPKIFAWNQYSDEDRDASVVMSDLMEWAADQCNYAHTSLTAVIASLVNPASLVYTEYGEVYRNVKREKGEDGKWKVEKILDETYSGFKDDVVPVDELFIENIYEHDIQKQAWLIWRKVISYDTARAKYGEKDNWQYVKPGVQVVYNDANATFYEVYDSNMRPDMVEEVVYWNKGLDVKLIMVNGIFMTDPDNPNPRQDKQYPFAKFGYELIDEGKFFYYKSLAFKMQQDANIINTLYPMIIDGTYLSVFPAMIANGSEVIGSDVIVPGAVTTFASPDAKLAPIETSRNLQAGMNALQEVTNSISESSQDPIEQGLNTKGSQTAYEISRIEQNSATILGLFIKMIAQFVKGYGNLRVGDIVQYLTIADADKITDRTDLVYKVFTVKTASGPSTSKKIQFTDGLPEGQVTEEQKLAMSYDILDEQGGEDKQKIAKANPKLFRELKFMTVVSPDVLQPRSEDLERALNLELYDRAIQNPTTDQEKITRDFLLGSYKNIRNRDDYMKQPDMADPMNQINAAVEGKGAQASPLQAMKGQLPQQPAAGQGMGLSGM